MKLCLCGGGSDKQLVNVYKHFTKRIDILKPILYIPLAMNEEKYDDCYKWFLSELKNMNLSKFEMVRSSLELSKINYSDYSALFIGGGNTFKLLKEIKENSNDKKIIEYLKNGGTVFGSSAGAIIFGKDINSCFLEDKNKIKLKDTSGLNILNNCSILCHLNNRKFKKNKDYLKQYSLKYKTVYLKEETVLYLGNNGIKLIGEKNYIIFKNGAYYKHNASNIKKEFV